MNINSRAIKIIKDGIENLNLSLDSFVVLTEVGSKNYIYTPIIPLIAGAKKVYAYTRDSSYGKAEDIIKECLTIADFLKLEDKIEFLTSKEDIQNIIDEVDLITNSGFLRPINKEFLSNAKDNIVVPLMFEAWEIREEDVDIVACNEKNIKVAGTWESHPQVGVFDYVKELTLKLIFEAGYEISGNSFLIWSNDHFGEKAYEVLTLNGAKQAIVINSYNELISNIKDIDAILLFDYHESRPYFGASGLWDISELKALNDSFGIIHLYGDVDFQYLIDNHIDVYPKKNGKSSNMTFTLSHVGLIPVLKLLVAGFKVGQEVLENNMTKLSQPINF